MNERTAKKLQKLSSLIILNGPPRRMKTDCDHRSSGNGIERDKNEFLDVLV